jgi:hypothetical protein
LFRNRDKASLIGLAEVWDELTRQYGDLFEFVLLGRRVTVALGPKGNNLSLGGKISQVSAEEAYTVSYLPLMDCRRRS